MAQAATFVPLDGRLTSLEVLNLPLTGGEVMEIVSPGNAQFGDNFQVTTAVLGAFFVGILVIDKITSGATLSSPYPVPASDNVVLFDKTIGSASYATMGLSASQTGLASVLIKDMKGDAGTNNITISFTGGELCDGMTSVVLSNPYAWARIAPYPGGGGWYQC